MLKFILNEADINVFCHETNVITSDNMKRSKKCERCVIIPYIVICCVLCRNKSVIALAISHPIAVNLKMASMTQKHSYLGMVGHTDRNRTV